MQRLEAIQLYLQKAFYRDSGHPQIEAVTANDAESQEILPWNENRVTIPLQYLQIGITAISIERHLDKDNNTTGYIFNKQEEDDGHHSDTGVRIFIVEENEHQIAVATHSQPHEFYRWIKQGKSESDQPIDLGGRSLALSAKPVVVPGNNLLLIIKRVHQRSKDRTYSPDMCRYLLTPDGVEPIVTERAEYWDITKPLAIQVGKLTDPTNAGNVHLVFDEDPNVEINSSLIYSDKEKEELRLQNLGESPPNSVGRNIIYMYGVRKEDTESTGPPVPRVEFELTGNPTKQLFWKVTRKPDPYKKLVELVKAIPAQKINDILNSLKASSIDELRNRSHGINGNQPPDGQTNTFASNNEIFVPLKQTIQEKQVNNILRSLNVSSIDELRNVSHGINGIQTPDGQIHMFEGKNEIVVPCQGTVTFFSDAPNGLRRMLTIDSYMNPDGTLELQVTKGIELLTTVMVTSDDGTISSGLSVTPHEVKTIEAKEKEKSRKREERLIKQKPEEDKPNIPKNPPENKRFFKI